MKKTINYDSYNIDDEMDELEEQSRYDHVTKDDEDDETEFEALDELSKEELKTNNETILLSEETLLADLEKKCENDRTTYSFMKGDIQYVGHVIAKMTKGNFIFSVEGSDNPNVKVTKKFNIADIENI